MYVFIFGTPTDGNDSVVGLVWDQSSVEVLSKLRIKTHFIGTHPSQQSQNINLHLPAILSEEQIFLLLETKSVTIINVNTINSRSTIDFKAIKEREWAEFIIKKHIFTKQQQLSLISQQQLSSTSFKQPSFQKPMIPISIHLTNQEITGISPCTLQKAKLNHHSYFLSKKFKIFKRLYSCGWIVTKTAEKFGGDYLLYEAESAEKHENDSFKHSKYIVIIVEDQLRFGLDFVSELRLATGVNKKIMYVWWNNVDNDIQSLEVEWCRW